VTVISQTPGRSPASGPAPAGRQLPAEPDPAAPARAKPIRVLHIITGLAAGGAEEQLRLLLPRLAGHGVSAEVAVFYQAGSVAQALRADGIPVTDLRSPGFLDRRGTARLAGLVRAGGYDVVHTHLFRAGLHGRIAARRAGVRTLVHTEHSLNPVLIEGRRRNPAIDRLYRWAERRGTLTVAVSAAVAAELAGLGVGADRIRVLPNAIDPDQLAYDRTRRAAFRAEHGLAADDFVVLCLGRLAASKRLELAIEAVAAIDPERSPRLRLLFVGAGEEQAALTALAEQLLPGRTVFTGELPGALLSAALSAADLLLSPSPEETFGLAVLGAAAVGLPVAFASCPALTELGLAGPGPVGPDQIGAEPEESGRTGSDPGSAAARPARSAEPVRIVDNDGSSAPTIADPASVPAQPAVAGSATAATAATAIQWVTGSTASLSQAVERALAARPDPDPAARQAAPQLTAALRDYDAESIAAQLAQLYRELLGPSPDGSSAPENDLNSQARTVGVHHV
jgi:glycosyltransferase involved in cell wall biosynthesis